jgi:hypothetical protein
MDAAEIHGTPRCVRLLYDCRAVGMVGLADDYICGAHWPLYAVDFVAYSD